MKSLLKPILALALFAGLAYSCHKDAQPNNDPTDGPPKNPPPAIGPNIRFDSLQVGQRSRYIGLSGKNYHTQADDFVYTDDTLYLKIVAQDDVKGYLVEESMNYVGDVHPWLSPDRDSVYRYYIKVSGDSLHLQGTSGAYFYSRFFFYELKKRNLPLTDFTDQVINLSGWKTELGYCECRRTGYTEQYTLFGQNYERLNVLLDNSPMALDGNGETYAYSSVYGIVRASTYSWWTSEGIGWDLLPEEE